MLRPATVRLGLASIRSARLALIPHRPVRPMTIQAAYAGEAGADTKKLYVGNLSWNATNDDLRDLFSQYGDVEDAFIPKDRETGRSRGFGFVVLQAQAALSAAQSLNETDFMGRTIRVNEAMAMDNSRPQGRSFRGGGGFRGGRGGGRRGGRNDQGYGRGYGDRNQGDFE